MANSRTAKAVNDPFRVVESQEARIALAHLHRQAHRNRWWQLLRSLSLTALTHEPKAENHARMAPYLRRTTGALLHQLALMADARLIVSIGSCGGLAAVWLACALRGGRGRQGDRGLICIEEDAACGALTRSAVRAAGVSRYVEVTDVYAPNVAARIDDTIDFVFVDGHFETAARCLQLLYPHLRHGAVVFAHDVASREEGGRVQDYLRDSDRFASLPLEFPLHCELGVNL